MDQTDHIGNPGVHPVFVGLSATVLAVCWPPLQAAATARPVSAAAVSCAPSKIHEAALMEYTGSVLLAFPVFILADPHSAFCICRAAAFQELNVTAVLICCIVPPLEAS
jgi:hypothetical protein